MGTLRKTLERRFLRLSKVRTPPARLSPPTLSDRGRESRYADHQAIACSFDDLAGNVLQLVEVLDPAHLGHERFFGAAGEFDCIAALSQGVLQYELDRCLVLNDEN